MHIVSSLPKSIFLNLKQSSNYLGPLHTPSLLGPFSSVDTSPLPPKVPRHKNAQSQLPVVASAWHARWHVGRRPEHRVERQDPGTSDVPTLWRIPSPALSYAYKDMSLGKSMKQQVSFQEPAWNSLTNFQEIPRMPIACMKLYVVGKKNPRRSAPGACKHLFDWQSSSCLLKDTQSNYSIHRK